MAVEAKKNASAILALASPAASSGVVPGAGADALLASDRGITAEGDDPALEIDAEDKALTAAAQDVITAVKTGDVTTMKDALRNAIFALHPRYVED
jgi:hypothetical protein